MPAVAPRADARRMTRTDDHQPTSRRLLAIAVAMTACAAVAGTSERAGAGPAQYGRELRLTWSVTTDFGERPSIANAIVSQGTKLVVAGRAGDSSTGDFALARYNADGGLDTTFGSDGTGLVSDSFSDAHDVARAVAIQQPGDKIVAAGLSNSEPTGDFALARYDADGRLDPTFGVDGTGKVTTDLSGLGDGVRGIAILLDGRILAAGAALRDSALVRYTADGLLDTSFGPAGTGIVTADLGQTDHFMNLTVARDGKIVAAGLADGDMLVARFNPDGTLDPSFGPGGRGWTTTDFAGRQDIAFDVAVRPDGKILVGGATGALDPFGVGAESFAIAQYLPDGSPDLGFGTGGTVVTDISSGVDAIRGVAIDGEGAIVAGFAGEVHGLSSFLDPVGGDVVLARYLRDGRLDQTFGSGGMMSARFEGDGARAVSLRETFNAVVVAGAAGAPSDLDFALAAYGVH
jgi:uncharacterized delta-60 repeat protein